MIGRLISTMNTRHDISTPTNAPITGCPSTVAVPTASTMPTLRRALTCATRSLTRRRSRSSVMHQRSHSRSAIVTRMADSTTRGRAPIRLGAKAAISR